jgi:hypothetical protein
MLTEKQVEKFQKIYRERFGKEISKADALEKGIKLVRLMDIVYKPITIQEFEKFIRRKLEKNMKQ